MRERCVHRSVKGGVCNLPARLFRGIPLCVNHEELVFNPFGQDAERYLAAYPDTPGYAYLARRADGLVKIGSSLDRRTVARRFRDLSSKAGMAVWPVHIVKGGLIAEQALHRRFIDYHRSGPGELFEERGALATFMRRPDIYTLAFTWDGRTLAIVPGQVNAPRRSGGGDLLHEPLGLLDGPSAFLPARAIRQ